MSTISGRARVAGITGWPVAHSLSPRLHGFWLAEHNLDGIYAPFPARDTAFETAVRGLCAADVAGLNVTVPHKRRAFEIADRLDPTAGAIGAVNTLVFHGDGTIEGRNTDAYGFIENLRSHGVDPLAGAALVLGAGGAARAAVHALLEAGVPRLYLVNRTVAAAEGLAREADDDRVRVMGGKAVIHRSDDIALLVNTTVLGMAGRGEVEVDLEGLPAHAVVHDIVYVPLRTGLIKRAEAAGLRTVDGLGMLLHQAVPAFEAFFGVRPAVTPALRAHLLEVL